MSFISHFNVAFSHWVFSLGAENVTTANTSGPTGEGLVFLTAVDSSAKFPCPWQGDWYVILFWAPIKGVEAWCLPEEDLTVLIAIRLMRSFRVILCIDFFFFFLPITIHFSGCFSYLLVHPQSSCRYSRGGSITLSFLAAQMSKEGISLWMFLTTIYLVRCQYSVLCRAHTSHCGLLTKPFLSFPFLTTYCGAILRSLLFLHGQS